ncbi:MAG: septum formation initiator family protein [Micrococcales bacterium]|nr:septum formation initiator family protein [Micrococcales bacterium]
MSRRDRTVRVPVAMAGETRSAAWLRNFRLSGFAFAALLLIVAALLVLAPGLKTYVEQRQQIAQLQGEVDSARSAVQDLRGQVARWDDPAYIEAQARGRLFYVFPGETSYLVTGLTKPAPATTQQPISDRIQDTRFDWTTTVLSSIYGAAITRATPDQLQGGQ